MLRKAQEIYGPGGVFQIRPGSCKEISAIDLVVTVDSKCVLDGALKKGPSDSSDTVVAFVVIQDLDGQFQVLPAQGPGEEERWRVRRTATEISYFDARHEAAAWHWSRSQSLEVRAAGAAHIIRLLQDGYLDEAGMILWQARDQDDGLCLYKAGDFAHMHISSTLRYCPPEARKVLEDNVANISSCWPRYVTCCCTAAATAAVVLLVSCSRMSRLTHLGV
jgi:hypothetical protein